ncbi:hypothetical protein Mnod_7317 [Methylobacterium nodulans ORS 2060]|uniref:Uncharacterized protein n=2 Tax=Methylobacterium nodulans TaxID=114616 RepID=B8ILT1_METNO|nr:hypothetical protein Mnod_7317 [Methylobacterium nodulans ORS 2060]
MGLTPRQIDALAIAEMIAMGEGFRAFHGAEDRPEEPDLDEFYRALAEARGG